MKKLICLFVLISCVGWATYPTTDTLIVPPSGSSGWDNASGTFRPLSISNDGELKIEGSIDLGDVTIDAVPSFKDTLGDAARGQLDAEDRVLVNTDAPASSVQCDVITVNNSVVKIGPAGAIENLTDRRSISIQNNSTSVSLWYRISGISPSVGEGLQIMPGAVHTIPVDDSIVIKMIAASEIPVVVFQEAR